MWQFSCQLRGSLLHLRPPAHQPRIYIHKQSFWTELDLTRWFSSTIFSFVSKCFSNSTVVRKSRFRFLSTRSKMQYHGHYQGIRPNDVHQWLSTMTFQQFQHFQHFQQFQQFQQMTDWHFSNFSKSGHLLKLLNCQRGFAEMSISHWWNVEADTQCCMLMDKFTDLGSGVINRKRDFRKRLKVLI